MDGILGTHSYYDALSPAAREFLITQLLARGRVHRPRKDDTFTSGSNPNDWARAGFVSPLGNHIDIGETENHILIIVTARYLTNQLMFQREQVIEYDNRRNRGDDYPACTDLLLSLLRNILRGDFSEYNAKPYQTETRRALLNLCTYAYDHEIRLGARMVLDYISAHMAVSSNDSRRLLPYRRRNKDTNSAHTEDGYMTVGLLDWDQGSDPAAPYFAMQTGNLRVCTLPHAGSGPVQYGIRDSGEDLVMEMLSDYRLPPSIHDIFVIDKHRRFFQRLHRTPRDEVGGNRNCDNMEIYASSPSYLITAGGQPALWAVDPGIHAVIDGDFESQQRGVAVTTSFIPTGLGAWGFEAGIYPNPDAFQLIQFGEFSKKTVYVTKFKIFGEELVETNIAVLKQVANYGVAPDFACGHQVHLPGWLSSNNTQDINGHSVVPQESSGFCFVNMQRPDAACDSGPGFYLAIYQETPGGLALLEAFDCWLHPGVTFEDFKRGVHENNADLRLQSNVVTHYTTSNGNWLEFVVWKDGDGNRGSESGAEVLTISYGDIGSIDAIGRADTMSARLVNGTIMNSPWEAVVQIANVQRQTVITLDFSDGAHPRRHDSETGELEVAGFNNEVWLDFEYSGPTEGDVCRPFNTVAGAVDAVADGGVIRVVPGATRERGVVGGAKHFKLVAPIGGVSVGAAGTSAVLPPDDSGGEISNRDVWVQFGGLPVTQDQYLFGDIAPAVDAVADGGVVHIQPGHTKERITISGKRMKLVAPIGGVKIGSPDHLEVWVNFAWTGQSDGDVSRPFNNLQQAIAWVDQGGTIKIMPGQSTDRSTLRSSSVEFASDPSLPMVGKHITISAPNGGVTIGTNKVK
jgi:hypothetical protein